MKIFMLHPHDIHSPLEPWTIRITSIAEELVKFGHEVRLVYTLREPEKLEEAKRKQIYPFETIPFIRYQFTLIRKIKAIRELSRGYDIIHFQKCFPQTSIPAIFAGYKNDIPIHYDWDDWEYQIYLYGGPSKLVGKILNKIELALPRFVDTLSISSEELRKLALKLHFPADRIVKAPVGADIEIFNPSIPPDFVREAYDIKGYLVMYVGQISSGQFAEYFLDICEYIRRKREDITFMIVGGGDYFPKLYEKYKEKGLQDSMILTGAVEKKYVPFYLASADVAVAIFKDNVQQRCKSPLKIAEYMASGKAIVASNVGEVPYMIGDCGVLVEPDNLTQMAEAILDLIDNPQKRKQLGEKARKRAEEMLTWKHTTLQLLKAYHIAINNK